MKFVFSRYIRHWMFVSAALSAILLSVSYSSIGGTNSTPDVRAANMIQEEPTVSSTQPPSVVTPETPIVSHGGPVKDQVSLIDTLRKTFPAIFPADTINQPFMSVPGTNLKLDGEAIPTVQVYEYQDEAAAKKDASKIQPNGEIAGFQIGWIAQPHFYQIGRIIVIYVGTDPAILFALESALGKPFAVGPDVPSPIATPIAGQSIIPGVPNTGAPTDNLVIWLAVVIALTGLAAGAMIRRRRT